MRGLNPFSKKTLLVFAIVFGAAGGYVVFQALAGGGITYYVSPFGSDTSSGTSPATAWKSVGKVNATCFQPGDTILFQAGQTFSDSYIGPSPSCPGTALSPITYSSYGTGRAVFTHGVWFSGGQHDFVFDNLELTSPAVGSTFASCAAPCGANYDITLKNSFLHDTPGTGLQTSSGDHDWLIQNNIIQHTGDSGIILYYSPKVTVDGNTITDTGWNSSLTYSKHGIYLKAADDTISNNDISNIPSGQALSIRAHGNLIFGNTVHDTPYAAAFFDYDTAAPPQGTTYIYNNRFWNIAGWGFYYDNQLDPQGKPPSVSFVLASNSFIFLSGASEAVNLSLVPPGASVTLANNIFSGAYSSAYRGCSTCVEHYNDWYGGVSNLPSGSGDLFVNPGLAAAPGLGLPPGSPLIDKGTLSVPGLSYTPGANGQPLQYSGSAPDIGAVEFIGTPPPKPGDLNGDGLVNAADLSILLSYWNTSSSAADINKDGTVNVFDLSILLSGWGK